MPKASPQRAAFTLIEVMISVLIISLVIMAIFSMKSNNAFLVQRSQTQKSIQGYQTFLLGNTEHGLTNESISLDKLIENFEVSDALRRELKSQKVSLIYNSLQTMDANASFFEIGKTTLKNATSSSTFIRLQGL
jgi:prepilin-type N-terminal cleavage/methylation domain-containing protein